MPFAITYSLRLEHPNSDGYYRSIAAFTDQWTTYAVEAMRENFSEFHSFRQICGALTRSEAEYTLELLALGTLLLQHRISSSHYPLWTIRFIASLNRIQQRRPRLEPVIKELRGLTQGLFLRSRNTTDKVQSTQDCEIDDLLIQIEAQGENALFHRFLQWKDYLQTLDKDKRDKILADCLALAKRFSKESDHALGKYSAGVESFLTDVAPQHRWRYDSMFISRTRLEYHLGMLATETLNRAYRKRFLETKRKVVIVPPCMRIQPDEDCKALDTPFGARCQACKPTCRVHHVTKLGEKLGFDVFIIPDELRGIGIEAKRGKDSIGLVGVSCALTNWSGGWDAEEMGVPAQGLLLDYVGCRYHWDDKGISTDTNLGKLKEMVGAINLSQSMEIEK
jgi:hypothetical protein